MPQWRVLLTDYAWPDVAIESQILSEAGAELVVAPAIDEATLVEHARDVDAIMTNWAPVTTAVVAAASRCRIIARLGIGLDNIDVAESTRQRIVVTNVPDYCVTEVAEHVMALVLALARKIAFFHLETKSGRYDLQSGLPIARIAGQTLGIVGLGKIGRAVAAKAEGFGLRVVATGRRRPSDVGAIEWCTLEVLLARSDYVSLHLPLTAETQHLVGAAELDRMKPTAFLINTARGGLVDHQALAAAISAGRLAGAGLDVHEPEPPDLSLAPWCDPRVIVTPHTAFVSTTSVDELRTRVARQVVACLEGRAVPHIVNPAAIGDNGPSGVSYD